MDEQLNSVFLQEIVSHIYSLILKNFTTVDVSNGFYEGSAKLLFGQFRNDYSKATLAYCRCSTKGADCQKEWKNTSWRQIIG